MQDVARVAQELSKGDNLVQTPGATPAGPANMVGVRFLLQLPTAESLKSSPVFLLLFHCLPFLLSLPFIMPLNSLPLPHIPSRFPFSPSLTEQMAR